MQWAKCKVHILETTDEGRAGQTWHLKFGVLQLETVGQIVVMGG